VLELEELTGTARAVSERNDVRIADDPAKGGKVLVVIARLARLERPSGASDPFGERRILRAGRPRVREQQG